jgi:hypothetical protein
MEGDRGMKQPLLLSSREKSCVEDFSGACRSTQRNECALVHTTTTTTTTTATLICSNFDRQETPKREGEEEVKPIKVTTQNNCCIIARNVVQWCVALIFRDKISS